MRREGLSPLLFLWIGNSNIFGNGNFDLLCSCQLFFSPTSLKFCVFLVQKRRSSNAVLDEILIKKQQSFSSLKMIKGTEVLFDNVFNVSNLWCGVEGIYCTKSGRSSLAKR